MICNKCRIDKPFTEEYFPKNKNKILTQGRVLNMCKSNLNLSQQKEWEKMITKINQLENELIEQEKQHNTEVKELRNMGNSLCNDLMDIKKKYMDQSKELDKLNKQYELSQGTIKLREDENNYLYSYIIENDINTNNMTSEEWNKLSKKEKDKILEASDNYQENEDLANAYAEYEIECDD